MSSSAERPRRSFLAPLARVFVAVLGVGLLAWTIRDAGVDRILAILPRAAPWLPLVLALEGARIGFDALATRLVLGERGRGIPFRALYAAQVAGHGVMGVFPFGRSASEVAKAALLSPWIGPEVAVAMGATNQANVLLSSAIFSLPCLAGALVASSEPGLAWAIVAHFVVLMGAGIGMRVGATHPWIEEKLRARLPRLGARARLFHEASRDTAVVAPAPLLAMFAGRAVQTLQYAVLAHAAGIGVGFAGALAVQGVNLVAAAIGVFVPAQIGSAELVFRIAADALHTEPANAVSIALLSRAPQFTWIASGLLVLLLWRGRRPVGTS